MSLTHEFNVTIKDSASRLRASEMELVSGDSEIEFDLTIDAASNDTVTLVVDVAACQSFWIVATGDLTMTENDDGTPDKTVALLANVPYWWRTGTVTNPLTVDVGSLKFVNAGAEAVNVIGAFLVNG